MVCLRNMSVDTLHKGDTDDDDDDNNNNNNKYLQKNGILRRHDRVCAQLQFTVCKVLLINIDNEHCMIMYQNQ
jgi:hypothetical protein